MAKRKKAVTPRRGSEMLGSRMALSSKDLNQLLVISRKKGVKLVDWTIYGQPVPDSIFGAYQVNPKIAGAIVTDLLKLRGVGFEVFPYGIPVPDNVLVRFRNRSTTGL